MAYFIIEEVSTYCGVPFCSNARSSQASSLGERQLEDPSLVDGMDMELNPDRKHSAGIIVFKPGKNFKM